MKRMTQFEKYLKKVKYIKSPTTIYSYLRGRGCTIPRHKFVHWYESQLKVCSYCDIPTAWEPLTSIKFTHRLSIDKIIPDKGYILDNMCLSCALCNLIKGNWFNAEEMREIAQKYIKPKWELKRTVFLSHKPTIHKGYYQKTFKICKKIYKKGKLVGYMKYDHLGWVKNV